MRILALSPHTDDSEFGCGATLRKFILEGHEVYLIVFSTCKESLQSHLPPDILITEQKQSSEILGITKLIICDYPVRRFSERRQDILEYMVQLKRDINPDIVFCPSSTDTHQDHQVISEECFRAFKDCVIYGYEMPWNNRSFNSICFSRIDGEHLGSKINSLLQYKSQSHRIYADEEFLKSIARVRGAQIKHPYAECFEVMRSFI